LLGHATARYLDSLYVAAEQLLGPSGVAILDNQADRVVSDLTTAPAWPTLRAHLILLAVRGVDPLTQLRAAAGLREIDTAGDVAAVIDWRLDDTGLRSAGTGPLLWIPGVPEALFENGEWGPYLAARASRVRALAEDVREATLVASTPMWARQDRPAQGMICSATSPYGAPLCRSTRPIGALPARHSWRPQPGAGSADLTSASLGPLPRIGRMESAAGPGRAHHREGRIRPLPGRAARCHLSIWPGRPHHGATHPRGRRPADDHAAAALWWRICGHLSPAVAAQVDADPRP